MNNYALTIGIPTWDRFPYLRENIEQLLREIKKTPNTQIEILVSDNASSDETQTYCESLKNTYPYFTYFRNTTNIGANKNFQQVLTHAQGKYVWLLGDDDKIVENCLARILDDIAEHMPDIVTGGCINDETQQRLLPPFIQAPLFTDKQIVSQYDLIRLAGKISVLIFNKEKILPVLSLAESIITELKTPWPHLVWVMLLLNNEASILFLPYGTNYFIEKNRYNMLQDGISRTNILVKEYAAMIYHLQEKGLLTRDFYRLLTHSITHHRQEELLKLIGYISYLNKYFPSAKNAFSTLFFIKDYRNKGVFFIFYVLPALLPRSIRKFILWIPTVLRPQWATYKHYLHSLKIAKTLLMKKDKRQIYDKAGL